jgi:hypothetical protein
MTRSARLLVAALVVAAPALATANDTTQIDWARGLVTAPGIGLADRQAPNPAVARGPSRRRAEDAAKQALLAALPALPLAAGGTVGDKLADPAVKARLDQAVASAITLTADPETDGSWRVSLAIPLEAMRQVLAGPRTLAPAGDEGAAVVIVEGVTSKPALDYAINGHSAPVVWVKTAPTWAKSAPRAKATSVTAAGLAVDAPKATASTLFVLITKS